MAIFITSDEHYGHHNMIRLCNRPFSDATEMDIALIDNHNNVVGHSDTTIHLGDFVWKGDFMNIVNSLNGTHIFIRGNHDHLMSSAMETSKYTVLNNQIYEFRENKKHFVCCHYPILEWNGFYKGAVHLYGHTHKELGYNKNASHVGVDGNNWTPININTFF